MVLTLDISMTNINSYQTKHHATIPYIKLTCRERSLFNSWGGGGGLEQIYQKLNLLRQPHPLQQWETYHDPLWHIICLHDPHHHQIFHIYICRCCYEPTACSSNWMGDCLIRTNSVLLLLHKGKKRQTVAICYDRTKTIILCYSIHWNAFWCYVLAKTQLYRKPK